MAKFIHFAPLSKAARIKTNGLHMARTTHRALGIYAVPCGGLAQTAITQWRRDLKHDRKKRRFAAIVFEIPDAELIHCYSNWSENMEGGNRDLKPAACGLQIARHLASENQGRFDGMEVVVPRSVKPSEILDVILPGGEKQNRRAKRRRQDEKLVAEMSS